MVFHNEIDSSVLFNQIFIIGLRINALKYLRSLVRDKITLFSLDCFDSNYTILADCFLGYSLFS